MLCIRFSWAGMLCLRLCSVDILKCPFACTCRHLCAPACTRQAECCEVLSKIPGLAVRLAGSMTCISGAQGRHMRTKVIADCVEALVGAFFIEGGEAAGFAFVCGALGLLPPLAPLPAPQQPPADVTSKSLRCAWQAGAPHKLAQDQWHAAEISLELMALTIQRFSHG